MRMRLMFRAVIWKVQNQFEMMNFNGKTNNQSIKCRNVIRFDAFNSQEMSDSSRRGTGNQYNRHYHGADRSVLETTSRARYAP